MVKKKVEKILKEVVDPELGINIVDLGLVDKIEVKNKKVKVFLIPTTPMCPLLGVIEAEIIDKLEEQGFNVEVEWIFDQPWNEKRMSKKARDTLGL